MKQMAPPEPSAQWQVGDRLWDRNHGTGTVLRLRERPHVPGAAPEALIEFSFPTPFRQWRVLANFDKLAPGEPARPPEGLRAVEIGQAVWHTKFGEGVVDEVIVDQQPHVARIVFASHGVRWIAVGGGHLRKPAEP